MRLCKVCNTEKPLKQFRQTRQRNDYERFVAVVKYRFSRSHTCLFCESQAKKAWYQENKMQLKLKRAMA